MSEIEDDSSLDQASTTSGRAGPSDGTIETASVSTGGLVGGAGGLDDDGFPMLWAGINCWDEDDEQLMKQLLDSTSCSSLRSTASKSRARRRSNEENVRKPRARRKSKESSARADDGSDGGSTKYASSSEVFGLSVYSLTDESV